ncbi:hypothetical protein CL634_08710 [bacterium]|nr:hypothetical protein [bacterium]|tara:strand:+ start:1848 stop:2105 length:258 start_codon:yes stop_codon:yes gene_type:complete
MQLTDEMREWLNARSEDVSKNGSALFLNFMKEFKLNDLARDPKQAKLGAKMLIRVWDAEKRGIPMSKTRKLPPQGRSGSDANKRS